MKKYLCILLIASALLVGCQSKPPDTANGSAADSNRYLEEVLNLSGDEMNEVLLRLVQDYHRLPEGYDIFLTENVEKMPYGKFIKKSNLAENGLYVYNEETNKYFLVDYKSPYRDNTTYAATKDYVYYVSPDEPNKVYRRGYADNEHILLYESAYGNISSLAYIGVNANGKLLLCEGNRYAVFVDISTGERTVLMEDDDMYCCRFEYNYFDSNSDTTQKSFILSWERTDSENGLWIKDLLTGSTRQVRFDPS